MTPGRPRFRFPDFSVSVSPVLPYSSGMLCTIALGMKETKSNMFVLLPFCLCGSRLLVPELDPIGNKEFTADDEEQNDSGNDIGKRLV